MRKALLLLLLFPFSVSSFSPRAGSDLVLRKVITGNIRPKSVVHSGQGLFFAQNMMYRHSITVYNRQFELLKTIDDEINPEDFGLKGIKGPLEGAPVEAAFSPNGKFAWISNYAMYGEGFDHTGTDNCVKGDQFDESFVYQVNTQTFAIEAVIQVGAVPKHLAMAPNGELLLVSNWCSGDVSVISPESREEICRLEIGRYPRGIAIDKESQFAYVAIMGGSEIAVIDLSDFSISYLEEVGRGPRHLCIGPNSRYLYSTLNHLGKVVKIDLHTFKVINEVFTGPTPRSMVLSDDGQSLYTVQYKTDQLTKVNTPDMTIDGHIATRSKPIGVTFDPVTRQVWVACYSGSIMIFEDQAEKTTPLPSDEPYLHSLHRIQKETELFAYRKDLLKEEHVPSRDATPELNSQPAKKTKVKPETPPKTRIQGKFCLVLTSFQQKSNATRANEGYKKQGISTRILPEYQGLHRVATGNYANLSEARSALKAFKKDHDLQAWVLKMPGT